jgi:hypothetical protein
MAAGQIEKWRRWVVEQRSLVYFFPLFQYGNHFSLLEINEREGSIFHHDSIASVENTAIQVQKEIQENIELRLMN